MRIDINIVAMLLLGVVLFIAQKRLDRQDPVNKTFLSVSRIILLELFFETVTCVINKRPELWLVPLSVVFHICLFVTAPILTFFWLSFVSKIATNGSPNKNKWTLLLSIPVLVNTVITLMSPFYHLVFYIGSDNVYHRGPLYIVSAVFVYFYLLLGFALIIKNRKKIVRQDYLPFCVLGILPAVGGVFQAVFYGVLLMWSCTAFSLIIVYIFLEERMIHLDYLTGTWNRYSFDFFISQRIKQNSTEKLGIIYVDIDGLKKINDEYGHAEGDVALKTVVGLVRGVIRRSDVIARLGGDEFAVILNFDDGSKDMLDSKIKGIEASMAAYNQQSGKPYSLQCSFGADVFCPDNCSIEQFMHSIDTMMYSSKKQKRTDGGSGTAG